MRRSGTVAAALLVLVLGACGGGGTPHHDKNASAPQADKCLSDHGARVTGDPDHRPPGAPAGLERELVAAVASTGAFIAFYDTDAHAKAAEPEARKNASRFKGIVVRDQNTSVIYTKKPSDDVRKLVEGCLF
jgi:hypothetical protein